MDAGGTALSVFTLDFRNRPGCASALVRGAALKFVRDGRVKVAANCIGNLRNIFTGGLIPLIGPDGHLQNLALAVRIGAAFREVLCCRFRLGLNFLWSFAVCHKHPPIQNEMAGAGAGWRENRELTVHPEPN